MFFFFAEDVHGEDNWAMGKERQEGWWLWTLEGSSLWGLLRESSQESSSYSQPWASSSPMPGPLSYFTPGLFSTQLQPDL